MKCGASVPEVIVLSAAMQQRYYVLTARQKSLKHLPRCRRPSYAAAAEVRNMNTEIPHLPAMRRVVISYGCGGRFAVATSDKTAAWLVYSMAWSGAVI
jgi:hypothetical protein